MYLLAMCYYELNVFIIYYWHYIHVVCFFSTTVYSRPTIKEMHEFIPDIAHKWYELGIELLDQDGLFQLDVIKCNHPNDISRCCMAMLLRWLEKNPNVTWHQLVLAVKKLGMNSVSARINALFCGMFIKCTVLLSCSY